MKKLSYIILGFLIGAVITYYFCPRAIDGTEPPIVEEPDGLIEMDKAEKLNNNWTEYREPAVDSAAQQQGRKKDNRWTEWSVDEIKKYVIYSEYKANKLGYDITGFRVYLGVYGDNAGQNKKNLTTMFIVPRGKKSHDKAGMIPFNLRGNEEDVPVRPLNRGNGGNGGYPN